MKEISIPYKIILASNSPRRQELLRELGFSFEVRVRPVDESYPEHLTMHEVALFLCEKKAMAFSKSELGKNELLITADTIVCLEDEILNKPLDRPHAIEMLQKLSGKKHAVITGVCLKSVEKIHSFFDLTDVYFRKLNTVEIEFYVDRFKPFDKAGAYGIQEWIGCAAIERIEGSYFNVVGLPTARLYEELLRF
jgi:septum formation protein